MLDTNVDNELLLK